LVSIFLCRRVIKNDGRGRLIAEVAVAGGNLSDWLLQNNLAKEWLPKQTARQPWTASELQAVVDAGQRMYPHISFDALMATATKSKRIRV
jgi:endonuclease YncB( thermonuclease family)